jgi:hypothetical protein
VVHQNVQDFIDRPDIEAVEGNSTENEIIGLCPIQFTNVGVVEVASDSPGLEVLFPEKATQIPAKPGVQLVNIQPIPPAESFEDLSGDNPGARTHFQD